MQQSGAGRTPELDNAEKDLRKYDFLQWLQPYMVKYTSNQSQHQDHIRDTQ